MAVGNVIVEGNVRLVIEAVDGRKLLVSWVECGVSKKRWIYYK